MPAEMRSDCNGSENLLCRNNTPVTHQRRQSVRAEFIALKFRSDETTLRLDVGILGFDTLG